MTSKHILLDSNLIVYSTNSLSSKFSSTREFLNKIHEDSSIQPILAHQNILESIRVMTHKKYFDPTPLEKAIKQIVIFESFCKIIYPQMNTMSIAINLARKYSFKADLMFDAYLIATMLSNNVNTIVTDNIKDFAIFDEIEVYNPFQ